MLVVVLGVGIFLGFAWLVSDDTTAEEHLQRIRSGGHRERRQAAFELANRIQHGDPGEFGMLGPDLVRAFEEAEAPRDPWVRQYLALALGTLSEATAVPALAGALSDPDETVRVYAAWALGSIGGAAAVAALAEASRADDAGLRTMAVYGLGAIGDPAGAAALRRAVDDPVLDVSVNAVVALARIGDEAASERLLGMMEADYWASVPGMLDGERTLARLSAVQAAGVLEAPAVRTRLQEVAGNDPDLRVREAALSALRDGGRARHPPPP
jgi:HEAT repeat protein